MLENKDFVTDYDFHRIMKLAFFPYGAIFNRRKGKLDCFSGADRRLSVKNHSYLKRREIQTFLREENIGIESYQTLSLCGINQLKKIIE